MTVYTTGWTVLGVLLVVGFFALELPAIKDRRPQYRGKLRSLTDHVRWLFATSSKYKGTPYWALRRILFLYLFLGTPAVLIAHFAGWF